MILRILVLAAAVVAVGGAATGSAWAAGIGAVAVLAGLAVVVRPARFLVLGGLALLVVAVVAGLWGWPDRPYDGGDMFAFVFDPDRERHRFLRESAHAAALILGGAGLLGALLRGPGRRWGRGAAGLVLLAWSAWSAAGTAIADRPVSRHPGAFVEPGLEMSMAVEPGPSVDVRAAVAMAVLLLGAALTAFAVASRPAAGE